MVGKVCKRCGVEKPLSQFRDRPCGAKRARCYVCEAVAAKERYNDAGHLKDRSRGKGYPDREDWHRMRRPWPWPPGEKVFDDVRLRRG